MYFFDLKSQAFSAGLSNNCMTTLILVCSFIETSLSHSQFDSFSFVLRITESLKRSLVDYLTHRMLNYYFHTLYMFTYQHETNLQWSLVSGLITFHLYVTYFPNKFTEHYIRNIRSCLHIRNCISSSTSVIILQAKAMENYCLTTSSYNIKNLKMETLPFLTHEDK